MNSGTAFIINPKEYQHHEKSNDSCRHEVILHVYTITNSRTIVVNTNEQNKDEV